MENIQFLYEELKNSKSSIRRAASKKLRKIKSNQSCPFLREALLLEIHKITWETQYQMIMAIGESGCHELLFDLYNILESNETLEPMVRISLGDAITRLEKNNAFLNQAIIDRDIDLIEGSLRAIVIEKINLPDYMISNLIHLLNSYKNRDTKYWLIAGAPVWQSPILVPYLKEWSMSENSVIAKAALLATKNKLIKFSIL